MTRPDAIILDIHMPLMDGDAFLRSLQSKQELSSIPVIQISAAAHEKRAGVVAALKKPLDLEALFRALGRCLG